MDAETKQKKLEASLRRMAEERAHELSSNPVYWDLVNFSRDTVGMATHDALQRFKWAEFSYSEGTAALSFVLCTLLAVVNRELSISPDQMGEMAKERLIEIRKRADEDDDED